MTCTVPVGAEDPNPTHIQIEQELLRQRQRAFQRAVLFTIALVALWLAAELTLALAPSQPRTYPMPPAIPICATDAECEELEAANPELFKRREKP